MSNMHPWRSALVLQFCWTLCQATSYSYYVDSSCSSKYAFQESLDDARDWSRDTWTRLFDAETDDVFQNSFKTLFHVDLLSPDLITVQLGDQLGNPQVVTPESLMKGS